jgi:N-acetylneuraminic acid mutarotase
VDGYVTVTTGSTTLTSTKTFTVHDSWSIGKTMPTARFGAFAGAIGTNIYVVGGATNSGYQVTNVNEIYNTQTNMWKTGAPLPTARELGASAVVKGILYVIGGSTGGSNPQNVVEAYNPVSNTWTTKAPMPNEAYSATTKKWTTLASMPNALETPGSATVGGRLYCFGGSSSNLGNVYNYVQIYQP